MAAVIEQNYDDKGIIWPITVTPFHVYILPVQYKGFVKDVADQLVNSLEESGVETLVDDRDERAGVKFNDADLIGIPLRITIGDKGLKNREVELFDRRTGKREFLKINGTPNILKKRITDELKKYNKLREH
jgi:prolyl-tRNA synthetase